MTPRGAGFDCRDGTLRMYVFDLRYLQIDCMRKGMPKTDWTHQLIHKGGSQSENAISHGGREVVTFTDKKIAEKFSQIGVIRFVIEAAWDVVQKRRNSLGNPRQRRYVVVGGLLMTGELVSKRAITSNHNEEDPLTSTIAEPSTVSCSKSRLTISTRPNEAARWSGVVPDPGGWTPLGEMAR